MTKKCPHCESMIQFQETAQNKRFCPHCDKVHPADQGNSPSEFDKF